MSRINVFSAKKTVTMDPNRPEATHVAVRDGRILAVGGPDCTDQWDNLKRDDRLADMVLMPDFVAGHAHLMALALEVSPTSSSAESDARSTADSGAWWRAIAGLS